MRRRVGSIAGLIRYPVKSMRGVPVPAADAGWHGLDGDRRLAMRRLDDRGGFPWLTASRLPALLQYTPIDDAAPAATHPAQVRTPDGRAYAVYDPALADELGDRIGDRLEMVHLNRGIFDEANLSIISRATVAALCAAASLPADVRRFRPNVLIDLDGDEPFAEDQWVGGRVTFGDTEEAAAAVVTHRDLRCAMVNYDPDTALASPQLLRTIGRAHASCAGVYATITRPGRLRVGQSLYVSDGTTGR